MLQERAMAPVRGINPKVGRKQVQPQRVEGEEIEPSVSEPMLNATQPATVADAAPADEPVEPFLGFPGLRVIPLHRWSPTAQAPSVRFATGTAPHPPNS